MILSVVLKIAVFGGRYLLRMNQLSRAKKFDRSVGLCQASLSCLWWPGGTDPFYFLLNSAAARRSLDLKAIRPKIDPLIFQNIAVDRLSSTPSKCSI